MATAPVVSDVLILGAGPAGLACAGGLARQLHTAVVFGNGAYRNARARHMHNVVGWDHADPSSYRAKAREEILARYPTIQFRDVGVRGVRRLDDDGDERGRKGSRFEVEDEEGERYLGRKVVLAMGMRDVMPDGPKGYEELWGYSMYVFLFPSPLSVLSARAHINNMLTYMTSFHCLFCHGFEERGASSAGVLATGPLLGGSGGNGAAPLFAPVVSRMANRLAGSVTVYTDGDEELGSRIRAQLKSKTNFRMENRRVVQLSKDPGVEGEAGVLVTLEDGTVNREGFLVSSSSFFPSLLCRSRFYSSELKILIQTQNRFTPQPSSSTDPSQRT